MMLIKCPECNKEISDKSEVCIHCGYPKLKDHEYAIKQAEHITELKCPECGRDISNQKESCRYCGYPIPKNHEECAIKRAEYEAGLNRLHESLKMVCPRCGGMDFRYSFKKEWSKVRPVAYCTKCGTMWYNKKKRWF